jgi:hypothetical protein
MHDKIMIGEDENDRIDRLAVRLAETITQNVAKNQVESPVKVANTYVTLGQGLLGIVISMCVLFGFFLSYNTGLHAEIQAVATTTAENKYEITTLASQSTVSTARINKADDNYNTISDRMGRMEINQQYLQAGVDKLLSQKSGK